MQQNDLISRKALLEKIDKSYRNNFHRDIVYSSIHNREHQHLMRMVENFPAVEAEPIKLQIPEKEDQNALMEVLRNSHMQILPGETLQEWISVKDRLPENDQRVLCFNYNGEYKVLRWNYIDWMWNSGIEWLKEDYVLYWMPLPEPPKGE